MCICMRIYIYIYTCINTYICRIARKCFVFIDQHIISRSKLRLRMSNLTSDTCCTLRHYVLNIAVGVGPPGGGAILLIVIIAIL